jgi:DNA polymerase III subunit delta'
MSWDTVYGQQHAKELLQGAIRNHQLAHAYLFWGTEGIGKDALALALARVVNCAEGGPQACNNCPSCRIADALQHPNVHFVCALPPGKNEKSGDDPIAVLDADQLKTVQEEYRLKGQNPYHRIEIPDAPVIKINSIRTLKRKSALTEFTAGRNVFIISNADLMNDQASTALLKTLEEPPGKNLIILTSARKESLQDTIISRCQMVHLMPLAEADIRAYLIEREGADQENAELIASIAEGSISAAMEFLRHDMLGTRKSAVAFVRLLLTNRRGTLMRMIDETVRSGGKPGVEQFLLVLHQWLRDAMILQERGPEAIHDVGDLADLQRFSERFPGADLLAALTRVERSIALVPKNVYLSLLLTTLAIELRSDLKAERRS